MNNDYCHVSAQIAEYCDDEWVEDETEEDDEDE